jgi:hypothetical protein
MARTQIRSTLSSRWTAKGSYLSRQRAAGFKSVQIWVPDPEAPGFAAECRRQSLAIAHSSEDLHDLEMFAEIADWGEG